MNVNLEAMCNGCPAVQLGRLIKDYGSVIPMELALEVLNASIIDPSELKNISPNTLLKLHIPCDEGFNQQVVSLESYKLWLSYANKLQTTDLRNAEVRLTDQQLKKMPDGSRCKVGLVYGHGLPLEMISRLLPNNS